MDDAGRDEGAQAPSPGPGDPHEAARTPPEDIPGEHDPIGTADDGSRATVGRRSALGALGFGVVGGVIAGGGTAWWLGRGDTPRRSGHGSRPTGTSSAVDGAPATSGTGPATAVVGGTSSPGLFTRKQWHATRGSFYYIAHRGSGDVYPENSAEAFSAAIGAGARCMEVSVGMTSDGRLICMHDQTYDRTTTATGPVATQPSTILRSVNLTCPQLGPAWQDVPRPRVPSLAEILAVAGGRAVLCLEAKVDAAYPSMMALAEGFGLAESLMVKAYHTSKRIEQAKAAGYPVFGYLGSPSDVTNQHIAALAAKLDPATDVMVVPAYDGSQPDGYLAEALVRRCVATGIPVWVFPVHRRADAAHFKALGVRGVVTSSFAYVTGTAPIASADTWRYKAIAPGEMSKDPSSAAWAPIWTGDDELTLECSGGRQYLTLGQFSPLAKAGGTYRIEFDARWMALPDDPAAAISLAFARSDDAYFEPGRSARPGYRGSLGTDGQLVLYRDDGDQSRLLGSAVATAAPAQGQWLHFSLDVTPAQVTWARTDSGVEHSVTVGDSSLRGGYLHIGRDSATGSLAFRRFTVS